MPSYDKSKIDEIARLRDLAISEIKRGFSNSSAGEMIDIETIDSNTIWQISEKAYRYSDKFYFAKLDASPREPHFLDFFLKELCKIQEFEDLVYEFSFSEKLFSVREEISDRHEEEIRLIEEEHEEELGSVEEKHAEELGSVEEKHAEELEVLETFEKWIEEKRYSSSQIDLIKSIFDLREKRLLDVSEFARMLNKVVNTDSDQMN